MTLTSIGFANPQQGLTMLHHPADDGQAIPFPSHADSMSLDPVRPKDVPRGKIMLEKDNSLSLMTQDIGGAIPGFLTRTVHLNGSAPKEEIRGSAPKAHYPEVNRVTDLSLTTDDIEKARPCATGFRTARNIDPMTPRYNLASTVQKPPTPPEMRIHQGRPRDPFDKYKAEQLIRVPNKDHCRNPADGSDIQLSQTSAAQRLQQMTPRNLFKTLESSGERILSSKATTPRNTDPLSPEYEVHTRTTHPFYRSEGDSHYGPSKAGVVAGSTPRVLHRHNGEPQASLIRSDLPGAVPQRYKGHMPFNIYDAPEVTPFSPHTGLDCKDIPGAQTGTRKSGTKV